MASTVSIKTAYPMDSVVTETDDDGLPVYDRAYNAADLRRYMRLAVTDGVWPDHLDELAVTLSGGTWGVGAGAAMAAGLLIPVDEAVQVVAQSEIPTGSYAFVIVAARFDSGYRDGAVYARIVEQPTYSPVRTESTWELVLARVDWRGTVTDLRLDNAMCGPVSPVMQPDTESFMLELRTAVSQFNLNVGTVEALPPMTQPTVVVRRPEQAGGDVYVDFGIPRGAPGEPGEDGDAAPTMYVQDAEPPRKAGNVWMVDDMSTDPHQITAIRVFEADGLWPSSSTWPEADLPPGGRDAWVDHVLSASLFAGSVAGGGNTVTLGEGVPTAPGSPGDVYIDMSTGEAYVDA